MKIIQCKLSKAQKNLLVHLKKHDAYLIFMEYIPNPKRHAYYFDNKTLKRFQCSTVRVLLIKGFLFDKGFASKGDLTAHLVISKEGK